MIIDSQPLRKFQTYCATWRFIAFHLCLFWARLIKSTQSHSVTLWFILMLSYHQCLGHPSSLFPSGLCTNILYMFSSHCMYTAFGMWWHTVTHRGGRVKGKLANGVGSQYSHTTSQRSVCSITNADAHTSAASSRLNWCPCRFKWTRPFWRKAKSGFCTCAITFQTHYTILPALQYATSNKTHPVITMVFIWIY